LITVKCLGHIGTSVGAKEIELPEEEISAEEIVARLRALSNKVEPGFTKFNTLVLVEDGEAFVPGASARIIKSGQKVVLIPFSHGG
jgi:molybdopterin converting factor small subunit